VFSFTFKIIDMHLELFFPWI